MKKMIFMVHQGKVHAVEIPSEKIEPYLYARMLLKVKNEDITPWQEANFHNGIATFQYTF